MSDASTPGAPVALDQAEKARLVRLERTVDRAVEVAGKIAGEALATIRDERLYRTTHTTWEAYLRDRFGLARSTAHDMIAAATAPPREIEGSSGRRTNPQPPKAAEPETDEAILLAEGHATAAAAGAEQAILLPDEPAMPPDAGRLWARVVATPLGSVVLAVDSSTPELPEPGARVLVAWER